MKPFVFIALGICTFAAAAAAQPAARRPGPEQARLGYFAGQWTFEGTADGLTFTGNQTCEWFAGGFQLVCRAEATSDVGPLKNQAVFSYDPTSKSYRLHLFNNSGSEFYGRGTVGDGVWTWEAEAAGAMGPFKARATMTEQSATAYTIRFDGFLDGAWTMLEEGRATKR